MNKEYLAFTDRGMKLAEKLASELGGKAWRSGEPYKLKEWTDRAFEKDDALIYVGACGIAVRAIAPHVVSKVTDPAVCVIDECGKFVIPVLSGHLGGANNLARDIAKVSGAVPVITTATDRNDLFAVDEWSKRQNAVIGEPSRIKLISSAVLRGDSVKVRSPWNIEGAIPKGLEIAGAHEKADLELDVFMNEPEALHVVPKIAVLGIGCKKMTPKEAIEECWESFREDNNLSEKAVVAAATIDIKKNEPGLVAFCKEKGLSLTSYTADELSSLKGDFTSSEFVKKITGVDSVCERSAVMRAGAHAKLAIKKYPHNGVTMALALMDYKPDWSWKYE